MSGHHVNDLDVPGFGPGHVSGLLQAHPEAVEGSKRCPGHAGSSDGKESQFEASSGFTGTRWEDELVCILDQVPGVDIEVGRQWAHPGQGNTGELCVGVFRRATSEQATQAGLESPRSLGVVVHGREDPCDRPMEVVTEAKRC